MPDHYPGMLASTLIIISVSHRFFDGLDSFATLLPSNQGIEGNFKHICLLTKQQNGKLTKKFLTSGYYDVLTIYAQINTDEKKYL